MPRPPLPRVCRLGACAFALAVVVSPAARAVAVDWVEVGAPGNACDPQPQGCFGAVAAPYAIARTEVSNAQYAAFLDAVAADDPHGLYHPSMASDGAGFGGITRSGPPGSHAYTAVAGREDDPVNYVSFHDALRFANWLHNGAPSGPAGPSTTEDGAYTITPEGLESGDIARNPDALVAVANEDEWYKAAYFDAGTASYTGYPAASDAPTHCEVPGPGANLANCGSAFGNTALASAVGAYPDAPSAVGTFDQGGNVWEWNETVIGAGDRGLRGGSFGHHADNLAAATRSQNVPEAESSNMGFRVVSLPEPGGAAGLGAGALALLGLRRRGGTTAKRG